jgi:hypothetical protein
MATWDPDTFPFRRDIHNEADARLMFARLAAYRPQWEHDRIRINVRERPKGVRVDTRFRGKNWLFHHTHTLQMMMDQITDFFTEEARLRARRSAAAPLELWERPATRAKLLARMRAGNVPLTRANAREALYDLEEWKECSNVRPSFHLAIIRLLFADPSAVRVFDACAGWGDRMVAAMAAGVRSYYGVEPNPRVQPGAARAVALLAPGGDYRIAEASMPDAPVPGRDYDLVHFSPPSFDSEVYNDEDAGQSVAMFADHGDWLNGFLHPTIHRCVGLLRRGGYLLLQSILSASIVPHILRHEPQLCFKGVFAITAYAKNSHKVLWVWRKV